MSGIIALFSSSRRHGNTGRLMDRIAYELGIPVVDLSEKEISAFDYEHRNRNDDFEPLMEQLLKSDQIIFASPVYWYAVSPSMKIFLDRLSDYLELPDLLDKGRKLRGKTCYVVCTSAEDKVSSTFINSFRETFEYLGMQFGGFIHANCANGYAAEEYEVEIKTFINQVQATAIAAKP